MKPSLESLAALEERTPDEVASWLAQGFLNWTRKTAVDPFFPHSFVHLSTRPVEAIEDLYASASLNLQASLQNGIAVLGSLCRTGCPESSGLTPGERLDLLNDFLRLCSGTVCFSGMAAVSGIACEDETDWERELFRRKVYPECLICLEDLALNFDRSAFSAINRDARQLLVSSLTRAIYRPQFQAPFAPRLFAALISIDPGGLSEHLKLIGDHVAEMHRKDPSQQDLSHLTAHRLVDKALPQLRSCFPKLDIVLPGSRDQWLISALFGSSGPLRYFSTGREDQIEVYREGQPDRRVTFGHAELMKVPLPRSELPSPPPKHSSSDLLNLVAKGSASYFDKSAKRPLLAKWH